MPASTPVTKGLASSGTQKCDSEGGATSNFLTKLTVMKYFMGGTLFFPMDIITWVNALLLLTLVAFLLLLIWRMLKPLGTLYRITSLAQGASGIPTYSRLRHQLILELDSSRRYQRPLSIAVLRLFSDESGAAGGTAKSNGNGNHRGMSGLPLGQALQLVFPLVGSVLQESMRSSDKVSYDPTRTEFVVVFTQTKKLQAEQAIRRLKISLSTQSHIGLKTGLAEFPTDGFILTDLVAFARREAGLQAGPGGQPSEAAAAHDRHSYARNLPARDAMNS